MKMKTRTTAQLDVARSVSGGENATKRRLRLMRKISTSLEKRIRI
jgi:hypothetical protein